MSVSRSRRVWACQTALKIAFYLVLRSQKFIGAPQAGAAKRGSRRAPPPSAAEKAQIAPDPNWLALAVAGARVWVLLPLQLYRPVARRATRNTPS